MIKKICENVLERTMVETQKIELLMCEFGNWQTEWRKQMVEKLESGKMEKGVSENKEWDF